MTYLSSAPCAVSVGVGEVVSGLRIAVVVVNVGGGQWIVVADQIRMVSLNPVVQDGDGNSAAADTLSPGILDVHIELVRSVDVPHFVPKRITEGYLGTEIGFKVSLGSPLRQRRTRSLIPKHAL